MADRSWRKRDAVIVAAAILGALMAAPSAFPARVPVTGAVYTTVNEAADGPGRCLNGGGTINCNLYTEKRYVWLNGGPSANGLGPDGKYFFAVLEPGGQPNPNDLGAKNLSDDFDPYTNRTFTVTNGEVSAYTGTHDYDAAAQKIRLYPYADTSNAGGVYIMAVCYIGADGTRYPVDPSTCKYDAFKAPYPDSTPPICVLTQTGFDADGKKFIKVTVQDPDGSSSTDTGSGIEDITIDVLRNATVSYSPDPWSVGTLSPIVITATKIDQTQSSFLALTVANVAGLVTKCDPEVPGAEAVKGAAKYGVLVTRRSGR